MGEFTFLWCLNFSFEEHGFFYSIKMAEVVIARDGTCRIQVNLKNNPSKAVHHKLWIEKKAPKY